jgi:phosphatidate cytidylyltransferase
MNTTAASGVTALRVAEAPTSGLTKRVLSALVLAPIALAFVWAGGWAFAALLAIAGVLMAAEWEALTGGRVRDANGLIQIAGAIVAIGATAELGVEAGLAAVGIGVVAQLVLGRNRGPWPALGAAYIGLPMIALIELREGSEDGLIAVLWLFAVVWAMDVFAYVAGKSIGGPKLAPTISPGKTWAGLIGGAFGSTVAGAVIAPYVGWSALGLALASGALGAFSQVGDLFESAVKRRFGVKDSGNLIPGHGGILDRVDGLVFAAVAVGIASIVFGPLFGAPR